MPRRDSWGRDGSVGDIAEGRQFPRGPNTATPTPSVTILGPHRLDWFVDTVLVCSDPAPNANPLSSRHSLVGAGGGTPGSFCVIAKEMGGGD